MKKVLILAYDFPPYNSIGAKRPSSWFKYLKKFGWYPIIVTRHWDIEINNEKDYIRPSRCQEVILQESDNGILINTPFQPNLRDKWILKFDLYNGVFIRKVLTLCYQILKFYFPKSDPTYTIFKAADSYLSSNKIDVIIATGEPFVLFKWASILSKKYKIPWIADYRDCWSNNYEIKNKPYLEKKLEYHFFKKIETRLIKSSSYITTAAPSFQKELIRLHNSKNVDLILNGFDMPKESITKEINAPHFEIAYLGTLYKYQPIEIFLEGFKKFNSKIKDAKISLVFYGLEFYPGQVERVKSFFEGKSNCDFLPRVVYHKLLRVLKKAQLLLILASSKEERIPAKLFDYLQANRKILLVENDNGILQKIIKECNAGFTADTPEEVAIILEKYYKEWRETGEVKHKTTNYEQYSRERQTEKLAALLDKYIM